MTQPATPEQLFAELDRLGLAHRSIAHAPVFTVDEAKFHRGQIEGGHCKNLFLKDRRDQLYLAVTLEDVPVDLKLLATALGAGRLSFAAPELLRTHLGVGPGSVTPFALINDHGHAVTVLLDETMLELPVLNFHPLVNTATTTISSADLLKFVASTGHQPRCLRFPHRLAPAIS